MKITVCVAMILLCCSACLAQPLDVVILTADTFEHQTQASSGQTTGQWCVLFVNSSSSSTLQIAAEDAWEQLAADEDKATIFAKVDLAAAPSLARRFSLSSSPACILFRDRTMFPLQLSGQVADADSLVAGLHDFIAGGYEHQEAQAVPAEASVLSLVMEVASLLNVEPNWMMYTGIAAIAVGLLTFVAFLVAGLWFSYAPDRPDKPAAAATEGAAHSKAAAEGAGDDDDGAAVAKESGESKPAATRVTKRRA